MAAAAGVIWHVVKRSRIHGVGVFARRAIPAGTCILEYAGRRVSAQEADRRHPHDPENPFHTFFFALSSGRVIDGGDHGNDARWINHSCEPNCDAQEDAQGQRVHIHARRAIARGEELSYDYSLVIAARRTARLKRDYACHCGTPSCRGTMLALAKKSRGHSAKPVARQAPADPKSTACREGFAACP